MKGPQEMPVRKTPSRMRSKNPEAQLRRRGQVLQHAINLFVLKGYDGTTMEEIADACGISKGSLYTSVGSKENLIFLIQEYVIEGYRRQAAEIERSLPVIGPVEALHQLIEVYLKTVDKRQDAYNFLLHVSMGLDKAGRVRLIKVTADVFADFERILVAGMESGAFRTHNPKLIAHHIVLLCSAWARNRWHLHKMMDLKGYINVQTELIGKLVGLGKQ